MVELLAVSSVSSPGDSPGHSSASLVKALRISLGSGLVMESARMCLADPLVRTVFHSDPFPVEVAQIIAMSVPVAPRPGHESHDPLLQSPDQLLRLNVALAGGVVPYPFPTDSISVSYSFSTRFLSVSYPFPIRFLPAP